ncbi:uncharacterized protein [Malus domestica]|uniref:uncharacterized protein n=1 Tax=Malus domestica TaxID=3750 RepID=UPI003977048B
MSNLNKLDFSALEVSGRNYLKWVQDLKPHLTAKGIRAIIKAPITDKPVDEAQKAIAMIFIQRHNHDALQTEYLVEEDPCILWLALADCFNHQKYINLPEARHDWQHLRFQDFKSVNKYNSEVCRIRSLLKFCKMELTESDLLENTYSTFHATNIVLQQQYRAQKFTKFSDLISALLFTEKQNQLLMKNHQARPTGLNAAPEAHTTYYSSHKRRKNLRGRGNRQQAQPRAQGQQSAALKGRNVTQ